MDAKVGDSETVAVCLNCMHLSPGKWQITPSGEIVRFYRCDCEKSPRHGDACCSEVSLRRRKMDSRLWITCDEWRER
jgi:hypothetical protein